MQVKLDAKISRIVRQLARKMDVDEETVLRTAIMELADFYLKIPHKFTVVRKETWDKFRERWRTELREEYVDSWLKMRGAMEQLSKRVQKFYVKVAQIAGVEDIQNTFKDIHVQQAKISKKIQKMTKGVRGIQEKISRQKEERPRD